MSQEKYTYKKYSPKFRAWFRAERAKLVKAFPRGTVIAHVGSTAVPGLGGKGIIDIAIETPKKKAKDFVGKASKLGFVYKKYPGDASRKFMDKIVRYAGKERRVHLHLTLDKNFLDSFLAVRDYLRVDKAAREEYAAVKKEAAAQAKKGRTYWKHKAAVLSKLHERAMKVYVGGKK